MLRRIFLKGLLTLPLLRLFRVRNTSTNLSPSLDTWPVGQGTEEYDFISPLIFNLRDAWSHTAQMTPELLAKLSEMQNHVLVSHPDISRDGSCGDP